MSWLVTPGLLLIAAVVASGCAPSFTPAIAAHSALRPVNSMAPCPPDGQGAASSTDQIDQMKLTVNARDMQAPVKTEGDVASTLTIEQVPVGSNRLVGLFGLSGGHALWRGVAQKVNVAQGVATNVDVLMARLGDVTCGRGADDSPRAFHTATVLNDGTVLLVGGAKEGQDASGNVSCGAGCHSLSATDAASNLRSGDGHLRASREPRKPTDVPRRREARRRPRRHRRRRGPGARARGGRHERAVSDRAVDARCDR